eukprot:CAMPEP_0170555172 /NCGR_PEP_ID=MMETSP0211-20121228/13065_1 /TAXON_ID=311385 /ORGANISM="Pseudokeronopsis sp., Strain OXSARD2" /LENGTH=70 /DNA_ID=CAMNT_0010864819 /DNA_START=1 /DNA_END=213 /DNA_ORIENTATION=-
MCLCFNKRKLERAQKSAALEQENDFLREDYLKIVKRLKKLYNKGEIVLNRLHVEKLQIYLSTKNIKQLLK